MSLNKLMYLRNTLVCVKSGPLIGSCRYLTFLFWATEFWCQKPYVASRLQVVASIIIFNIWGFKHFFYKFLRKV